VWPGFFLQEKRPTEAALGAALAPWLVDPMFDFVCEGAGIRERPVDLAPNGTVTDPKFGDEIGNVCDE